MRLQYFYLKQFQNITELEISFDNATPPRTYAPELALRFLVGPNGSGKSHVMEALGMIFTALAHGIPIDLQFVLLYDLGDRRVCILNEAAPTETALELIGVDLPEHPQGDRLAIYIRQKGSGPWQAHDGDNPDVYCPSRVAAVAAGPTTGFHWAMYDRPRVYLAEQVRQEWGSDEVLDRGEAEAISADAQARWDQMLDNPRTLVMNPGDSRYAVLAMLLFAPTLSGPEQSVVERLTKAAGIQPDVAAFSLVIDGNWANILHESLRAQFHQLLRLATVRLLHPLSVSSQASNPGESPVSNLLATFDVTPALIRRLTSVNFNALGLFLLLMAGCRRQVIRDIHLALLPAKKSKVAGLLPAHSLSDGEYLRLGRYAILWMLRDEPTCLVMLDEPDTFFNDRWKVDLVRDTVELLRPDERPGGLHVHEVLIATHSAIALSDAFSHQVYQFKRGQLVPGIAKTFGADLDTITTHISQAPNPQGSFSTDRIEGALKRGDRAELETLLAMLPMGYNRVRVRDRLEDLTGGKQP